MRFYNNHYWHTSLKTINFSMCDSLFSWVHSVSYLNSENSDYYSVFILTDEYEIAVFYLQTALQF